jgi:hypothetical protein
MSAASVLTQELQHAARSVSPPPGHLCVTIEQYRARLKRTVD